MKTKFLFQIVIGLLSVVFMSSCLDMIDEEEQPPTRAEEMQMLNTYLDSLVAQGHDVDTTDLGIYYVEIEEGEGETAQPGDTLVVGYAGYFVDGQMFDSSSYSSEDGKMEFVLENPPFIAGWDSGMKVMNEGSKYQFVIPSEHAYGSGGQGIIPPYSTLIFVVKMFDIKPAQ